jgi:hypothetical protein
MSHRLLSLQPIGQPTRVRRPRLPLLSVLAGIVLGVAGYQALPIATATFFPAREVQLFSDTDAARVQYDELVAYVESSGRPRRIVQVDLEHHPKISQYTDIDSSPSGYGKNACALVAAAAALGGKAWVALVDQIAEAAGRNYGRYTGIQPSKYVAALRDVFGGENVTAKGRGSLGELHRELDAGNIVIVDIKVHANTRVPSASGPNYAHFARILGLDVDKQEIYIENTLRGGPYWTLSLDGFLATWNRPETTASIILDPQNAENVTRWAVVIDGALVPEKVQNK